jgi:ribosomal protein L11 methyltransferase
MDNDPQALAATRENAARNQLLKLVEICSVEAELPTQVDVLIANILAAPLIILEPRFAALLRSGGRLVLSGILESQQQEIQAAYAERFQFIGEARRGEWLRLEARRRPKDR